MLDLRRGGNCWHGTLRFWRVEQALVFSDVGGTPVEFSMGTYHSTQYCDVAVDIA